MGVQVSPDATSLDRLHDLIPPPAVPWWPPAPAWYWVLGCCAVALVVVIARAIRHRRRDAYRREALALLASSPAVEGLPELIKRTALSAYPRERVAALTGDEWLAFLDRTAHTTDFRSGPGRQLSRLAYQPHFATTLSDNERAGLIAAVRNWIVRHSVEAT